MEDVKALLRKKRLDGPTVGRVVIYSYIDDMTRAEDAEPYIDSSRLTRLFLKLKDEDRRYYDFYSDMSLSLRTMSRRTAEIYNNIWALVRYGNAQFDAIDERVKVTAASCQEPLIVTRERYKQLQEGITYTLEELTRRYARFFALGTLSAPDPIKAILEEYKVKPASVVPLSYSVICDQGYFLLEDGRRSCDYTADEWRELKIKALGYESLKDVENAASAYRAKVLEYIYTNELESEGITRDDLSMFMRSFDENALLDIHDDTPPTDDLDIKYDRIMKALGIPGLEGQWITQPDHVITVEDTLFYEDEADKANAPELFSLVADYLQEKLGSRDHYPIKDIKAAGIFEPYLWNLEKVHADELETSRALRGILVTDNDYREPELPPLIQDVQPTKLIKDLVKRYNGYRAIVDVLAEVYQVPELVTCKPDLQRLQRLLDSYNTSLFRAHYLLADAVTNYEDARRELRENSEPIRIEDLLPDAEKVKQLKDNLVQWDYDARASNRVKCFDIMLDEIIG